MSNPKQQNLEPGISEVLSAETEKQHRSNDRGGEDSDSYASDEDDHKHDEVSEAEDYEDEDYEEDGNDDKRSTGRGSTGSRISGARGNREKYRERILGDLKENQGVKRLGQLNKSGRTRRLLLLARDISSVQHRRQQIPFFRFERLAILNLLCRQHQLVEYDEKLRTHQDPSERKRHSELLGLGIEKSDIVGLNESLSAYCKCLKHHHRTCLPILSYWPIPRQTKTENLETR